jgi:hypothetical protein
LAILGLGLDLGLDLGLGLTSAVLSVRAAAFGLRAVLDLRAEPPRVALADVLPLFEILAMIL